MGRARRHAWATSRMPQPPAPSPRARWAHNLAGPPPHQGALQCPYIVSENNKQARLNRFCKGRSRGGVITVSRTTRALATAAATSHLGSAAPPRPRQDVRGHVAGQGAVDCVRYFSLQRRRARGGGQPGGLGAGGRSLEAAQSPSPRVKSGQRTRPAGIYCCGVCG